MDNLILVESPTKAKTLSRFLGEGYKIEATMGHIRDLPTSVLGVDTEHDFRPKYVVSKDRKARVKDLKNLLKDVKTLILATDPDREGEAIAWHILELLKPKKNIKVERIAFHEITENAIKDALKNPREIDYQLVNAQQARRVLDRLVGYKLSPLLWYKIRKGLSAGRVQSVAVRLIAEREREIEAFKAIEYWEIEANLKKLEIQGEDIIVKAKLSSKNNEKIEIHNKDEADKIVNEVNSAEFKVIDITQKEIKKNPYPPFMTSTLQQAAGNRFGWSGKKTMQIAQLLYEDGFITYHRTDSFNLSIDAVNKTRDYIKKALGDNYLPPEPKFYKTKSKVAQEAHEAIRPTIIDNPEELKEKVNNELGREASKLYDLIWKRMVACQVNEAIYNQTTVDIGAKEYIFRATGLRVKFDGWKRLYSENTDETAEEGERILPPLSKEEILKLIQLLPTQHFTEPPPRYTEASLVKSLEEKGIGRPSTYAPIISTIQDRQYVEKIEKKFHPTFLGIAVNDFLMKYFSNIVDYSFTANMEDQLDAIARGEVKWVPLIREFYDPFITLINETAKTAEKVKVAIEETNEICDKCGNSLVIRVGKFGKFLACSKFPECNFTKPFIFKTDLTCPKCGGNIILRRTRKGKHFYGCSNYPNCDFASWTKTVIKSPDSQKPNVK